MGTFGRERPQVFELTHSLPSGLPLISKSSGVRQSEIYQVTLGNEWVNLHFLLPLFYASHLIYRLTK